MYISEIVTTVPENVSERAAAGAESVSGVSTSWESHLKESITIRPLPWKSAEGYR